MPDIQSNIQQEKLEIPHLIRELTAVIAIIVDQQGFIQEANKGFLKLVGLSEQPSSPWNIRKLFLNPVFTELATLSSSHITQAVYQGIMNIGQENQAFHSITGSVFKHKDKLLLIAEYDIQDLEQLTATVIELNDELTQIQRNLVNANRKLKRNEAKITQLMLTDQLTGIANRRHFDQQIKNEFERHQRYQQPLSLVIGDIDFFKQVNDNYGHAAGDQVICAFADILKENKRDSDFVARIGGEEFVILLPQTKTEEAYIVTERIRELFCEKKYKNINCEISASFGISCLTITDSPERLLKRADHGLYQAKETGKNKVVIANPAIS